MRFVRPRLLLLIIVAAGCGAESDAAPSPAAAGPTSPSPAPTVQIACGHEGLRDCPLQSWMKANLNGAMRTHDFDQLDRGLTRLAALAPDTMPDWTPLAQAGRVAVHARDLMAIREACVACHDQYRRRYRAEMRDRPLAHAEAEAE